MKFLQADDVPWQRVVSSSGTISDRGDAGEGASRQAERLRQGEWLRRLPQTIEHPGLTGGTEGVEVTESGTPVKYRINLAQYGWCEYDLLGAMHNLPSDNCLDQSLIRSTLAPTTKMTTKRHCWRSTWLHSQVYSNRLDAVLSLHLCVNVERLCANARCEWRNSVSLQLLFFA